MAKPEGGRAVLPDGLAAPAALPQHGLTPQQVQQLPQEQRVQMLAVTHRQHSGPLPDPDTFRAYGEVVTEAPRMILDMAKAQQDHDIWMERVTLKSESLYRMMGLAVAAIVVLGMVGGAVVCALQGAYAAAAAFGVASGLATLAGVFVRGRDMATIQASTSKDEVLPVPKPGPNKRKGR